MDVISTFFTSSPSQRVTVSCQDFFSDSLIVMYQCPRSFAPVICVHCHDFNPCTEIPLTCANNLAYLSPCTSFKTECTFRENFLKMFVARYKPSMSIPIPVVTLPMRPNVSDSSIDLDIVVQSDGYVVCALLPAASVLISVDPGKLLLIYICNFHVLSDSLLIYICKLHWNLNTMFVCQVNFLLIYICNFHVLNNLLLNYICKLHWNRFTVKLAGLRVETTDQKGDQTSTRIWHTTVTISTLTCIRRELPIWRPNWKYWLQFVLPRLVLRWSWSYSQRCQEDKNNYHYEML